ncbi:hypothetical protein PRNP1_008950 [Phytophthora ramorum]
MPELEKVIWTMLRDVVNPSADDTYFPRFRHFSWCLGHSYSHGVTSIGKSEDVNFYRIWYDAMGPGHWKQGRGGLVLHPSVHAIRTYYLLRPILHPE